jgi:RNA polymerase sigma-70 factor (ECF subfamily)
MMTRLNKKSRMKREFHVRFCERFGVKSRLTYSTIKYQEVIALRYFEQKSISEIGLILGKNEGTVKSLVSRGFEKLRNML